jgi:hypothetical protein
MIQSAEAGRPTLFEDWSEAFRSILVWQWRLVEANCQAGLKVMEAALAAPAHSTAEREAVKPPPSASAPVNPETLHELEQLAADRARQGLVPPKEIYEAPYRNKIDWSIFPAWARPSDPELFADCAHEG